MIHHFSLPAADPRHVAHVLGELLGVFGIPGCKRLRDSCNDRFGILRIEPDMAILALIVIMVFILIPAGVHFVDRMRMDVRFERTAVALIEKRNTRCIRKRQNGNARRQGLGDLVCERL